MVLKMNAYAIWVLIHLYWPVSAHVLPQTSANDSNSVLTAATLFPMLPIVVSGSVNQQCGSDSQLLLDGLRNSTTWAEQMFDSSAKSAEGVYYGSFFQMGNFEECVNTEVPIQGQYCLATITLHPPASATINLSADIYNPLGSIWDKIGHEGDRSKVPRNVVHSALCVPASCSHSDLQASLSHHLASTARNHTFSVEVKAELCQTNRKGETFSEGTIAYCAIMGTVFLVVILATLVDGNTYSSGSDTGLPSNKLGGADSTGYLRCFSLKLNLCQFLKSSESRLGCIYGLRVFSTFLVIFSHRLLLNFGGPLYNSEYFERGHADFVRGIFSQVETVVDSFFLMSGILVTYITLGVLKKTSVNPFHAIFIRYLRLTPVYAVVVFFYATLLFHMGEGPLWTSIMGQERQFCIDNWWTNLLYINNYVNDDRMCMVHSWYMAPELHFYVISTLLILLIHKRPKVGHVTLGIFMAASLIIPFTTTYLYHMDPVPFFYDDQFKLGRAQTYFRHAYSKSHVHATPTFVGIATGLFLYRTTSHDTKYTWQSTLGVVAGALISLGCLVPGALMITRAWNYNDVFAALEQPQRRLFWPLGVALVITSLVFSKNSYINKLLSSHIMVCLSNLTYSAYLVSFGLQLTKTAAVIGPQNGTDILLMREGLSDICLSFAVAFVLYLTVEVPFENLMNKLLKRGRYKLSSKN